MGVTCAAHHLAMFKSFFLILTVDINVMDHYSD